MWDAVEMTIGIWEAYVNGNEVVVMIVDEIGVWNPTETKGLVEAENGGIKNGKVGDLDASIWISWTIFSNFRNWNQISWSRGNKSNSWLTKLEIKVSNLVSSNTVSESLI